MPDVQGGVETHAEQLYTRLADLGCDVEVIVRSPFVSAGRRSLGAIKLRRIWAPRRPGLESLAHSCLAVLYAAFVRPDILHIHAIGPAIVTPLARLMGLKVVVTHHGPDYDRDKWGILGRFVLRIGERWGMRWSNARIAISGVIRDLIQQKHGQSSQLITNGVVCVPASLASDCLVRLGLERGHYFLAVARIVPEKRQNDLISAFAIAKPNGWRLALVGSGDDGDYARAVRAAALQHEVVLAGFQSGEALRQLYSHAGAFVLPSSHEGLPIALLEALSFGLPVIASAIPGNLEVGLPASAYFPVGDVPVLARRLVEAANAPGTDKEREQRRRWVKKNYNWDKIARQTLDVYRQVLDGGSTQS